MIPPGALAQVSWACVHFAPAAERGAIESAARGAHLATVDGGLTKSEEDLLDRVAAALRAPAYFGRNWDALDEVLCDLEWLGPPATGFLLAVEGAAELWSGQPRAAGRLVEAWLAAAERWSQEGMPFHLVFLW